MTESWHTPEVCWLNQPSQLSNVTERLPPSHSPPQISQQEAHIAICEHDCDIPPLCPHCHVYMEGLSVCVCVGGVFAFVMRWND